MKPTLLISLEKDWTEKNWSLAHEMRGAVQRNDLEPLQIDGVIPVGPHAVLFDPRIAHNTLVRLCAHLTRIRVPYCILEVDESSIVVEGKCGDKLQAIVSKNLADVHEDRVS